MKKHPVWTMPGLRQLQCNDFLLRMGHGRVARICPRLINAFIWVIICSKQMNSSQCLWAGESLSWNHDIVEVWHFSIEHNSSHNLSETHCFSLSVEFVFLRELCIMITIAASQRTKKKWKARSNTLAGLCKKLWFSQASAGLALLGLSKICQSELTQIRFLTR